MYWYLQSCKSSLTSVLILSQNRSHKQLSFDTIQEQKDFVLPVLKVSLSYFPFLTIHYSVEIMMQSG